MSTQSNNTSSASGGIGFSGLLTILFVGLKLTHVINWSWWWVFAPMWVPALVGVLILLVVLAVFVLNRLRR